MKLRLIAFVRKSSAFFNVWLVLAFLILGIVLARQGIELFSPTAGDRAAGNGAIGGAGLEKGDVISGAVRVSDGDSLRLGRERVRLIGIDAPELDQTCKNPDGSPWPCGRVARQRLAQLVAGENLQCTFEKRDRYGRALAICLAGGIDIGSALVSEGLAVSYNDYPEEEARARARKRGLWSGQFITPRNWRRGQR